MRVYVGLASELPQGEQKSIEFGDDYVLVIHSLSGFWAIEDRCSHDDNELYGGDVEERPNGSPSIKCLRHGARFDLATGKALSMPAVRPVKSYQVVLINEELWLEGR
jgi:3-phenylpropionate/trans-cinnamate dioxygenase ferredoxin component